MAEQAARHTTPAKDRLLHAAIEHLSAHGLADLSLRQLAAALGTSHRMLIYHFGSREGLLVEVVQAVEAEQRQALLELREQAGSCPRGLARSFWQRLTDPALAPQERLFFELYSQALRGRPYATPLLDNIVEAWLEPLSSLLHEQDIDGDGAHAEARLAVAVARGLLLDLLATGERAPVDAAFERYLTNFVPASDSGQERPGGRKDWSAGNPPGRRVDQDDCGDPGGDQRHPRTPTGRGAGRR